jgi:hypothetical protein
MGPVLADDDSPDREQINAEWDDRARTYFGRLKDAGRLDAVRSAHTEIGRLMDAVGFRLPADARR